MVSTTLLLTLILTFTLTVPLVHSEEIAPLEQDLKVHHQVGDEVDNSYDFKDEQSASVGRLNDQVTSKCCEGDGLIDSLDKFGTLKDKITGLGSDGNGLFDSLNKFGTLKDKITGLGSDGNGLFDSLTKFGTLKDEETSPCCEGNELPDSVTKFGTFKDKVTSPGSEGNGGFFDSLKKYGTFKPIWSKSNPDLGIGHSSSTTVYAFSYENLFIIVAIKALLAFVLFGGFGFAPFLGRSVEQPDTTTLGNLLGGAEDLLFTLAYLNGRPEEGYTCLQRQACLRPARGEDILLASGMLENAVHLVQSWTSGTVSSPHSALSSLEEALDYSYSGGDCRQRYSCSAIPTL